MHFARLLTRVGHSTTCQGEFRAAAESLLQASDPAAFFDFQSLLRAWLTVLARARPLFSGTQKSNTAVQTSSKVADVNPESDFKRSYA